MTPEMTEISLADFKKIDLRVGRIMDVQEVAGADKLWKLVVDIGTEKKEIVAGIKLYYPKESLQGKFVVVVNNLAPAVIRGVESKGMLLAAKDASGLVLLSLDKELGPGSSIG